MFHLVAILPSRFGPYWPTHSLPQAHRVCIGSMQRQNGVEQFGLLNGFGQISRHSQIAATFGIGNLRGRGKHHQKRFLQTRIGFDVFDQHESVHLWHLCIEQDQRIRLAKTAAASSAARASCPPATAVGCICQ